MDFMFVSVKMSDEATNIMVIMWASSKDNSLYTTCNKLKNSLMGNLWQNTKHACHSLA